MITNNKALSYLLKFSIISLTNSCIIKDKDICKYEYKSTLNQYANMKITKIDTSSQLMVLYGTDNDSGKPCVYDPRIGWYVLVKRHIAIGDTFIKKLGSNQFYLKNNAKKVKFSYECGSDSSSAILPVFQNL